CTEYGIHMPLAISWKPKIPANQICKKLISFIDITATIHEAMSISAPKKFPIMGKSFLNSVSKLRDSTQDNNSSIYAGRERHSSSRYNSLGYPQRCIRTDEYLYIINFRPERWPAGPGQKFSGKPGSRLGPEHGGYHDIDACPTLSFMIAKQKDPKIAKYFHLAVNKRPKEQLFNIRKDPGCLNNLANDPKHAIIRDKLSQRLVKYLTDTNDPRALNGGDIFETYKRYSSIRWFPEPEWVKKNPESVSKTPWLRAKK
ncbi:MAG: heparan N-sulfatase, partial [Verrucomicrobiota bacterium]|nr:heparan N-sulfatase [Verrucomicrobiota bacterium]